MERKLILLLCLTTGYFLNTNAQYFLNGSATQDSCHCFTLTPSKLFQSGSVWRSEKLNLNESFDLSFKVFLGCKQNGADGIAFVLQQNLNSLGDEGYGLGYQNISPSLGVTIDTYQNEGDPNYDHLSVQENGNTYHNADLLPPVPASASKNNIKDCQWHVLRIVWQTPQLRFTVYFDGVKRGSVNKDIVRHIFNGNPEVYWGFTGATGGAENLQKFCNISEPAISINAEGAEVCLGDGISFENVSQSSSPIKEHQWDFGDGSVSSLKDPTHNYMNPGNYTVDYQFISNDGCESRKLKIPVKVGDIPELSLKVSDTCAGKNPAITLSATSNNGTVSSWEWLVNGLPFSQEFSPDFTSLTPGEFGFSTKAITEFGCESAWITGSFTLKKSPAISFKADDICKNEPAKLSSEGLNEEVAMWKWFRDGEMFSTEKDPDLIFENSGEYAVTLMAQHKNGCISNFTKTVYVKAPQVSAGNDTIVLPRQVFQLSATGGVSYAWSPPTGLSNPAIANPAVNIDDEMRYVVKATSADGCSDTASVFIRVFKGSSVFVPGAFTPNGDGLNESLKPALTGIKNLEYFSIFNRWGQRIFHTAKMDDAWEPAKTGNALPDVYTWILKAEDEIGKIYKLKGTVLLLE